VRSKASINKPA